MCILCPSLGIGDFVRAARHCKESVNVVEGLFGSNSIELAHEMHKLAQLLFNRYIRKWRGFQGCLRLPDPQCW